MAEALHPGGIRLQGGTNGQESEKHIDKSPEIGEFVSQLLSLRYTQITSDLGIESLSKHS
jgi:hypothetical protein